jgi:ATP-dependent helicase/nuclease subunit B
LQAHLEALLNCAVSPSSGEEKLLATQDGQALLEFFSALQKAGCEHISIAPADYPALFNSFAAQIPVRALRESEPRLHIYGLLEARLLTHDRLVLGGLNEGVWPAAGQMDLWLSRGMRGDLQLPLPERRIGLSAHDFAQGLGVNDVWLTRSLKSGGDPAVRSRFVQRLGVVTSEERLKDMRLRGDAMLAIARLLDQPNFVQGTARPAPRPPQSALPRKLSVTDIEALLRDPYAIYAKHILRLKPFEQQGAVFDARLRGQIIHEILSEFARAVNDREKPEAALLEDIARRHFAPYMENAEVKACWWPRFRALVPELAAFETERRKNCASVVTEKAGALKLNLPAGEFCITARADRIEKKDKVCALIDFKTGQLPQKKKIDQSYALQLILQAAMLEKGAFSGLGGMTEELIYVGLNKPDGLELREVEAEDLMALARRKLASVQAAIEKFDAGAAFVSRADTPYAKSYRDYHHLARVGEWGVEGDEEAEA